MRPSMIIWPPRPPDTGKRRVLPSPSLKSSTKGGSRYWLPSHTILQRLAVKLVRNSLVHNPYSEGAPVEGMDAVEHDISKAKASWVNMAPQAAADVCGAIDPCKPRTRERVHTSPEQVLGPDDAV